MRSTLPFLAILACSHLVGAWAENAAPDLAAPSTPLPATVLPPRIQNLLAKEKTFSAPSSRAQPANSFEKAVDTPPPGPVQLDVGGNLPLPNAEDERLGPNHKDVGFHIGLDFHPDKAWELSGVAGVKMNNGPVAAPSKPSMDQVGVEARMKF